MNKEMYRKYISGLAFKYGWASASLYDGTITVGTTEYEWELLHVRLLRLHLAIMASFLR